MPVEHTNRHPLEAMDARMQVVLDKDLSGPLKFAVTNQTGFNTVASNMTARAADGVAKDHLEHAVRSVTWWNAMKAVAGDAVWNGLDDSTKIKRLDTRAEYVVACRKIQQGMSPVGEFDASTWTPSAAVLQQCFLEAAEFRRSIRGAYVRGIGASNWCGLDHTKTTGELFGHQWLATLTNEIGQLLSVLAVDSTKAQDLLDWAKSISKRANFTASSSPSSMLVVDNVPTNFVRDTPVTQYKSLVCEALNLKATLQER